METKPSYEPLNPYTVKVDNESHNRIDDASIRDLLAATGRWQRFFSVLFYLGCFLCSFVLLSQILVAMVYPQAAPSLSSIIFGGVFASSDRLFLLGVPARHLGRSASYSKQAALSGEYSFEEYVKLQRAFWRYVGWVVLVFLVLYGILISVSVFRIQF